MPYSIYTGLFPPNTNPRDPFCHEKPRDHFWGVTFPDFRIVIVSARKKKTTINFSKT